MIPSSSRRNFFKSTFSFALAAAGAGLAGSGAGRAAATPPGRMGKPLLRPSLNAYSFAKLLGGHSREGSKGLTLADLVKFCAENDFDGLDATGYYFPGYKDRKVPDDKYIFDLKRRAFDQGVGISGTGVGNNFTTADKAARANDVQWIKQWVEVAAKLGAPVLRVFADTQMRAQTWENVSNGATRDEVEKWIAADIRECADHAVSFGVIIGVQNHGDFIKTADNLISLLARVDSPWCGAIVDTGYFRAEDPYAEIAKAAPYAVNWQVKQSPLGVEKQAEAPVDIKRLIQIVRKSGYRGYLPIETLSPRDGSEYDPFSTVPKFLAEVRAAIAATA